ncbi:MAG: nucleotidyltransferase family protein [Gemmatimonadales bacterium]
MLAAIVTAAGASERMGGHPKALLDWHGETFLGGILKACFAAGIERRVVTLGHDADRIRAQVPLDGITVVESADLAAGPIGSVRAGLATLMRHPVDGVLIWPVDRPHVQVSTIEALLAAFDRRTHAMIVPLYDGRRGHPVAFARSVFGEIMAAPDREGARAVVRRDPSRVLAVAVDDRAVIEDVNTPDEYRNLLRRGDQLRLFR